jgi:hypothetical protein
MMFKLKSKTDSDFFNWRLNELKRMTEHESQFRDELLKFSLKQMKLNAELKALKLGGRKVESKQNI